MNKIIPRIAIEGNIGSGKTTLLQEIQTHFNYPVFYERIHTWKFLEKFYQDPKRYSFIFQLEILFSYAEAHTCSIPHLTERCTGTGFHVFTKLLYQQGQLTDQEFNTLKTIWEHYNQNPTLILYLDVDPETCLERIKKRSRHGESPITLEYLKDLDARYNSYLDDMASTCHVVKISDAYPLEKALHAIKNHIRDS